MTVTGTEVLVVAASLSLHVRKSSASLASPEQSSAAMEPSGSGNSIKLQGCYCTASSPDLVAID